MKIKNLTYGCLAAVALLLGCSRQKATLNIEFPERYEGKTVEMMTYSDSVPMGSAVIKDRKAQFVMERSDSLSLPCFMQLSVDGRICAFYIAEKGVAHVTDSTTVASGTPLNDRLATLIASLDSIEDLDDMDLYVDFAEKAYNSNRDNPISDFFGIEWLKFANPERVDSLLAQASPELRNSKRARHYENFAKLRLATAPGHKYVDFAGEDSNGRPTRLSKLIPTGKYTIIDFWASWCPYCIREIPDLKRIRADFGSMVEVVGVAVRDLPDDTKAIINKQEIEWPVLFNTNHVPYDIYGFSGIPHLILVAPDGTIVSRGESAAQVHTRLEKLIAGAELNPTAGSR